MKLYGVEVGEWSALLPGRKEAPVHIGQEATNKTELQINSFKTTGLIFGSLQDERNKAH
jgi:hypothetical protein